MWVSLPVEGEQLDLKVLDEGRLEADDFLSGIALTFVLVIGISIVIDIGGVYIFKDNSHFSEMKMY